MKVRVNLATGRVAFLDAQGAPVLVEKEGGRSLVPAEVQGEKAFHARQEWDENEDESLYGLGQHQLGLLDVKGYDLELWQHNATVVVPFLVSSRGYGILWDNPSYTRFGDLREWAPIPADRLLDASGRPGGLTGSYHAGAGFEKLVATRADQGIDIEIPGGTKQPNLRIHPSLPPEGEIERAVGGRGRGDRERRPPVPAVLERRDPDVGGRPAGRRPLAPGLAARGRTSPACLSRRGGATA